jgi:hypothetical protein
MSIIAITMEQILPSIFIQIQDRQESAERILGICVSLEAKKPDYSISQGGNLRNLEIFDKFDGILMVYIILFYDIICPRGKKC